MRCYRMLTLQTNVVQLFILFSCKTVVDTNWQRRVMEICFNLSRRLKTYIWFLVQISCRIYIEGNASKHHKFFTLRPKWVLSEATRMHKGNENYWERIPILQQGQWPLFSSHGTKHPIWNRCAQGRCTKVSPTLNRSRQTAHSSWSEASQLNLAHLNLLELPFFDPNTSVCNSPGIVDLPLAYLRLCLLLSPI